MNHRTNPVAARLLLALTVLPTALLVPTGASADTATPSTKAQVEHAERQSAPAPGPTNKAQVERDERAAASTGRAGSTVTGRDAVTTTVPVPGGGDAAAWQLAASAALGAVVAGGVLVTSRRFVEHRRPLAS